MLECLQFMFSGFWIWLGGLFYLCAIASAFNGLIRIAINKDRK